MLLHSLPTVYLTNLQGIVRSNCPGLTIYPGMRDGNATPTVSSYTRPWNHSELGWYKKELPRLAFPSVQQPESSRPFRRLISQCLSVYQPTPIHSFPHPQSS